MYVALRNPMYRLIALGVTLAIFLLMYFTVIKPSSDTANQAVRTGEQQVQQAINQANQQTKGAVPKSGSNVAGVAVPKSVSTLTSCLASAGTDVAKVQACDAKFKP
jgi:flagellar biosynthesis/type III secretory pathway M-ring protein FliF/YscJ